MDRGRTPRVSQKAYRSWDSMVWRLPFPACAKTASESATKIWASSCAPATLPLICPNSREKRQTSIHSAATFPSGMDRRRISSAPNARLYKETAASTLFTMMLGCNGVKPCWYRIDAHENSPPASIAPHTGRLWLIGHVADGDFLPARSLQRKNSVIFTASGEWGFYDCYGRGIAKWEVHDIQERSRGSSISVQRKNASMRQMC
jgi:hypothetical protein